MTGVGPSDVRLYCYVECRAWPLAAEPLAGKYMRGLTRPTFGLSTGLIVHKNT